MMNNGRPPVVSLRVPGVDHSAAEPVLDALSTEQVDEVLTRGEFWRWRPPPPDGYTAEAYLWGVRSGPAIRATWMLMLPFTLVNVAYWARPAQWRGVVSWAADASFSVVCRLIGLTLTATLTLAATGVTMDLIAWQCLGRGKGCTGSWAQPFDLIGEARIRPGQRLALAAAVPLVLLWLLWYVSYRTWQRYERRVPIEARTDRLSDARFWGGRSWVERLRATHLLAGMAIVDGLLVYPLYRWDARAGGPLAVVGLWLLALIGAALVMAVVGAVAPLPRGGPTVKTVRDGPAVTALQRSTRLAAGVRVHSWAADRLDVLVENARTRTRAVSAPVTRTVRVATALCVAVTAGCLVYAASPRLPVATPPGALPGYATAAASLAIVQTALLLVLAACAIPLAWIAVRSGRRVMLHGLAAPVIATVAVLLATGEAASTLHFAALLIGEIETSQLGRIWEPAPPYPYQWAGLVFVVTIAAGIVAAFVHWVRWRALLRRGARVTDGRDPTLRLLDPDTAGVLDRAHARGLVLAVAPTTALIVFVPMTVLSFVGVLYSAAGRGPEALLPSQQVLAYVGTWSIGLVALTLVVVGARAGMTTPVRRIISAIWALATFWPRAGHPFGAPAHGPRSVADLVLRVNRLVQSGQCVVLAGHSHGALLATTAVLYLPPDARDHTALLTSASPVTRLMEPLFGGYYHEGIPREVADRLTDAGGVRWRNLYRITDPIGGPVFRPGGPVDVLVPDPDLGDLYRGIDTTPRGHNHYLHNRVFLAEHSAFVNRLATRSATHTG